jgi:predicted GNAT family N-acyltransferase
VPFFVVSRPPPEGAPESGGANDFVLMAGASEPHTTRDEAESELVRLRTSMPAHTHIVIEAPSSWEALLRGQHPDGSNAVLEIELIGTWAQMLEALDIRHRVFVSEQGVAEEEEIDEHDVPKAWGRTSLHVLGRLAFSDTHEIRAPIATARLLLDVPDGGLPHIGRVAVLPEHRRAGYGTALMRALEEEARRRGFPGVTLAAQLHAIPFYEAIGYVAHGPVFLDAGIEHRQMDLRWG